MPKNKTNTQIETKCGINAKHISFFSNEFQLSGTLHLPEVKHPPVVIGAHGLLSTADSPKQISLARQCNRLGIGFFRFDHRGCGKSPGDFKKITSFSARCKDLESAVELIKNRTDTGRKMGLFGSSFGGAASLYVAGRLGINAVVTLAAPVTGASILESAGASADLKGLPVSFYEKCLNFDIRDQLKFVSGTLIFHGDADEVVPPANSREIYDRVKDPKRLVLLKKGDHRISDSTLHIDFILESAAWFNDLLNEPS